MKPIQNSDPPNTTSAPPPAGLWPELKAFVLQQLTEGLPPDLFYHGIHHTRDDVLPAAVRLATLAGLDPESALILRTAALCHDVGFMVGYQDHELNGVGYIREWLPRFRYTEDQIDSIVRMILATTLPQHPAELLEALLCDADLDSLGREDYLTTSLNLRTELAAYGQPLSLEAWYRRQHRFLTNHRYFTEEARGLRDAGKEENIQLLERLLKAAPDAP